AEGRRAAPAIVAALRDPRGTVRVQAAVTLVHLKARPDDAVRALTAELRAADATDRERAATALGDLVAPPPGLGFSCWGPDPPPAVAHPWVGERTLPALLVASKDEVKAVRAAASRAVEKVRAARR